LLARPHSLTHPSLMCKLSCLLSFRHPVSSLFRPFFVLFCFLLCCKAVSPEGISFIYLYGPPPIRILKEKNIYARSARRPSIKDAFHVVIAPPPPSFVHIHTHTRIHLISFRLSPKSTGLLEPNHRRSRAPLRDRTSRHSLFPCAPSTPPLLLVHLQLLTRAFPTPTAQAVSRRNVVHR
jgi:hypothetical protein